MKRSYNQTLFFVFIALVAFQAVGCSQSNIQTVSFDKIESLVLYSIGDKANSELVEVALDKYSILKEVHDSAQLNQMFAGMRFYEKPGPAKYDPGLAVITLANGEIIRFRTNSLDDAIYVITPENLMGYYKLPDSARGRLFALQDKKIIS